MAIKVGALRPTQAIFTYGVGASIELPHLTGIVMGLEEWNRQYLQEITEERLLQYVKTILGPQVRRLCAPPMVKRSGGALSDSPREDSVGIPVATFPTWLRCPVCNRIGTVNSQIFELKPDPHRPDRTCYRHINCQKSKTHAPIAVPVRFMVACEHGHFDDFPWDTYVHQASPCGSPKLRIQEIGLSGAASDVLVICDTCGVKRTLAEAFGEENRETMPFCQGRWPHLRESQEASGEEGRRCDKRMKSILLGASNSWFPMTASALYIPAATNALGQLVEQHWTRLGNIPDMQNLEIIRSAFLDVLQPFAPYSTQEIWEEMERKRNGPSADAEEAEDLKGPEWAVMSCPDPSKNTDDFHLTPVAAPAEFGRIIEKVVLVERLREVRALMGFTRIDAPGDFGETQSVPDDRRAPLSRSRMDWTPASEVRGEGIFLQFREDVIARWRQDRDVQAREREFFNAHRKWKEMRQMENPEEGFPGMRFIVLHSFSHALMRQISLECGYTAASIRERLYSCELGEPGGPRAGVLIYTAAPDSEGTLGGLVRIGAPQVLGRMIAQALEEIRLCSSDPLCAEHTPQRGAVSLHAGACHACLFSPETSCERGNRYLDRNVLVSTVQRFASPLFEMG